MSRSLFPSSGIDKNESEINQADNKENESAAQIIKKASNSVRKGTDDSSLVTDSLMSHNMSNMGILDPWKV